MALRAPTWKNELAVGGFQWVWLARRLRLASSRQLAPVGSLQAAARQTPIPKRGPSKFEKKIGSEPSMFFRLFSTFSQLFLNFLSTFDVSLNFWASQLAPSEPAAGRKKKTRTVRELFAGTFRGNFSRTFRELFANFSRTFRELFANFSRTFRELFGNFSGTFRELFGNFSGTFRELFGNFSGTFRELFGNFSRTFRGILGQVRGQSLGFRVCAARTTVQSLSV